MSSGFNWKKAYIKFGLLFAPPVVEFGFYSGISVELSISTWFIAAVATVAAFVSLYNPAIAAFSAKIIAAIKTSAKTVAASLALMVPLRLAAV